MCDKVNIVSDSIDSDQSKIHGPYVANPVNFIRFIFNDPSRSPLALLTLGALYVAALAPFMIGTSGHGVTIGRYRIDLDVYRLGSQAWIHGRDLYGTLPVTVSGAKLPFSYPPIAAILFTPFSLVPMQVASTALILAGVGMLAFTLALFLRSVLAWNQKTKALLVWLLPVALLLEPVRNTMNYGQINLVLMLLVSVDCLGRDPRWPRGALVGIAAAVKLTPAVFILYFLVKKDYRAAMVALLSFAASTGIGFLLAWRDSVEYWTSVIFQPGRDGSLSYAANQSIQGVLARAGLSANSLAGVSIWIVLSLAVVIVAWLGMCRFNRLKFDAWVLSLNALVGLLISPISWSHHWIWAEPALLTLIIVSWKLGNKPILWTASAGVLVLALAPHWLVLARYPNDLAWPPLAQIIGSSYVVLAFAILLLSIGRFETREATQPAVPREPRVVPCPLDAKQGTLAGLGPKGSGRSGWWRGRRR